MHPLTKRLQQVRRHGRRTALLRVIALLLAFGLAACLLVAVLDRLILLPGWARALGLAGTLGALGWFVARLVLDLRPQRWNDLALAQRLEARFPQFRERLLSAVQFLEADAGRLAAGSPMLHRRLLEQTSEEAAHAPLEELSDARSLRWLTVACLVLGLSCLGLSWRHSAFTQTALRRLTHPFGDHRWTVLWDQTPAYAVLGQPLEIRARVEGITPRHARLRYWEQGRERRLPAKVTRDQQTGEVWVTATLVASGPLHYRLEARDAAAEQAVSVLPAPDLLAPAPILDLRYPEHTGLPPARQQGRGDVEAVRGAKVVLRAAANRPLRSAWVEFTISNAIAAKGIPPISAALESSSHAEFVVELNTADLPAGNYSYSLVMEDEYGLRAVRRFDVRLFDDPAPTVAWEQPRAPAETLTVLDTASLPLAVLSEDSLYGLKELYLFFQPKDEPAHQPHQGVADWLGQRAGLMAAPAPFLPDCSSGLARLGVVRYDLEMLGAAGHLAHGLTVPLAGVWPMSPAVFPARLRRWVQAEYLRPAHFGFQERGTFVVRALAVDNHSRQPGRTWSPPLEVRLISATEFDRLLEQHFQELDAKLGALQHEHGHLLQRIAESTNHPVMIPQMLADVENHQRLLLRRLTEGGSSLAKDLERIELFLRDNQADRPKAHERLKQLAEQIAQVRDEQVLPTLALLRQSRNASGADPGRVLFEVQGQIQNGERFLAQSVRELKQAGSGERLRVELQALEERQRQHLEETRRWNDRYAGLLRIELPLEARDGLERLIRNQHQVTDQLQALALEWQRPENDEEEEDEDIGRHLANTLERLELMALLRNAEEELEANRGHRAAELQLVALQRWEKLRAVFQAWRLQEIARALRENQEAADGLTRLIADHSRQVAPFRDLLQHPDPLVREVGRRRLMTLREPLRLRSQVLQSQLAALGYRDVAQLLQQAFALRPESQPDGALELEELLFPLEEALRVFAPVHERQQQRLAAERVRVLLAQLQGLQERQQQLGELVESWRAALQSAGRWTRPSALTLDALVERQREVTEDLEARHLQWSEHPLLFAALSRLHRETKQVQERLQACRDRARLRLGELVIDSEDQDRLDYLQASLASVLADAQSILEALRENLRSQEWDGEAFGEGRRFASWPEGQSGIPARRPSDPLGQPKEPWSYLTPRLRKELEQYQKDRFLPKYEDECARYYQALSEKKNLLGD